MVVVRTYIIICFVFFFSFTMLGQVEEGIQTIDGIVTYLTSKNVYVRFDNTELLKIGDTLFSSTKTPCLLITNKSSNSVVCKPVNDCIITKGSIVYIELKINNAEQLIENETNDDELDINYNDSIKAIIKPQKTSYLEDIRGRISAASYSTFSDKRDDRHRVMGRLMLNAYHLNFSKFSFETYMNYRKNIISGNTSNNFRDANNLRIFNLALTYEIDSTLFVTLGRKINYKISSLGAIDGVQAEKQLGQFYVGAIGGFRPDLIDFGFNSNLLQYGAYAGIQTGENNFISQTTIGFAEQRNDNAIDRRFAYLQHSSTIKRNLNLFSIVELDVFNKTNDTVNTGPRLTNLYVSARYRFSNKLNMTLSYDSRKQIIYYKTYESDIDELLDEDIARQGLRARLNVRPLKKIFAGLSYSKRFQSDNQNQSNNYYGYISYNDLPAIGGRVSLAYNLNSTNYLESNIASIRYSNEFWENRLSAEVYYRFVDYSYKNNLLNYNQHYFGTFLSYFIDRTLIFSVSGEVSLYELETNYRINTRIIKRFGRTMKKRKS